MACSRTEIRRICDIVHEHGGQVYLDGANLNAQVGLARPADYGADVGHLNLHKTFCIPHGGGGPGMGPIGVKAHLAPFLPGHPEEAGDPVARGPGFRGAVRLRLDPLDLLDLHLLMGGEGLTAATKAAILNANYVATPRAGIIRCSTKAGGRVAHECIIDMRPLKEAAGVTVEDVAKRLIDYGFHAPTMSFPVAGTLMIEPTIGVESRTRPLLRRHDRDPRGVRVLEHAGAAQTTICSRMRRIPARSRRRQWERPYSRAQACFPLGSLQGQILVPVNRIDNVYGDRNLLCSCPSIHELQEAAE